MINCKFENGGNASLRHVTVDTLVLKNKQILLVKRALNLSEGGKWGLAGGYMERDETILQAAAREVYEETGWEVEDLTLLRIADNPSRPKEDRQNVAFVYFCTATAKTGKPDDESTEQKWFYLDKLPDGGDLAFDHAENIHLYRTYLKHNLSLPLDV